MNTLLIGYDLNKSGQNYDSLIKVLQDEPAYWHHLDSTWVVRTNETAAELRDRLSKLIDSNDELLVVNITGDSAAWAGFNATASKWLKDHI